MSLFIGRKNQLGSSAVIPATDLIAKCITEETVRQIISKNLGILPGGLKFELFSDHIYNDKNIDCDADANTYVSDGWLYPNGKYVVKEIFPELYEHLCAIDYPTSGDKIKVLSNGLTYIQLPNISGYLYPNNQAYRNANIEYANGTYTLKSHSHPIAIPDDDTVIVMKKAAWIWSTTNAGSGVTDVPAQPYGGYSIPETATAHSAKGHDTTRLLTWDIPVKADATAIKSVQSTTGPVIPVESGTPVISSTDTSLIQPKTLECSVLMFAGFPQPIGR